MNNNLIKVGYTPQQSNILNHMQSSGASKDFPLSGKSCKWGNLIEETGADAIEILRTKYPTIQLKLHSTEN